MNLRDMMGLLCERGTDKGSCSSPCLPEHCDKSNSGGTTQRRMWFRI